jgi:twitching motility protein PilJ
MSSGNKDTMKNSQQATYVKFAVLLVFLLASAVFVFSLSYTKDGLRAKYLGHLSELRVLSQQIATNATEAANGKSDAFSRLESARFGFDTRWLKIRNGDPQEGLSADSEFVTNDEYTVGQLQAVWQQVSSSADSILKSETDVIELYSLVRRLKNIIPSLLTDSESVVDALVQSGAPADQVTLAERQVLRLERMQNSLNQVLEVDDGPQSVAAADNFHQQVVDFEKALQAMQDGSRLAGISAVRNIAALSKLRAVADGFVNVSASVEQVKNFAPRLYSVRSAANRIFNSAETMLVWASELTDGVRQTGDSLIYNAAAGVLGGCAILVLVLMLNSTNRQTRRLLSAEAEVRAEEEQANQRNQQAILRLLDELGDLADGDLTVETTVTEDFTGAIADSINFTIDQLRSLVSTINETAVKVTGAAQETQSTAKHLAEASDHQAQEIAGASAAVNQMAMSIDQVSANALESSSVAERSVEIANKGADVVRATINGMDTIREQIQETSKRIKRLGESSQEIGDIVSLINDIADQTNILALNAAIQASMAGDAGRGFAVVADEVQRLAERASGATKQIEALVKTIQNDTNEAVISMEQTTAQVVNGARLAQDAGVALGEIETVSKSLADLIQNISNAARQQAASAGQISKTMNVIQEITSQTSAGTTATANSIGHLADLANQMRNSVAGFKLPEAM